MAQKKNLQPFFMHSANSRNEDNLIRLRIAHGAAGYGVYFMLIERLRQAENYECDYDLDVLSFDLRESENLIESVINDFDLFELIDNGERFRNIELSAQMERMEEQRLRRQAAAQKAAAARWETVRRAEADRLGISYEEYIAQIEKPEYITNQGNQQVMQHELAAKNEKPASGNKTQLKIEIETICEDKEWKQTVLEQMNLPEKDFHGKIEEFRKHCEREGKKGHKDLQDAKSHFVRWLLKRTNSENQSQTKGKDKADSEKEFLKATAEQNRRMEEQRKQREKTEAENAERALKNRLRIIELGYDPEKDKIWDVLNPDWREKNPPKRPSNTNDGNGTSTKPKAV